MFFRNAAPRLITEIPISHKPWCDASTHEDFSLPTKKLIPIDSLTGVARIVALSLLQEHTPGTAAVISEVLRNFSTKLETGEVLHPGEASYLANALRQIAADPDKYAQPFGYKKRTGRPGNLNPIHRMAIGKRVDELHRPRLYGVDAAAMPLNDNSSGVGTFCVVADEFGTSVKTVERIYQEYLHFLNQRGGNPKT